MGLPLVLKEAGVGVDVGVLGWVGGAGGVGAVLGVGAVGVLGPEAVEDEGGVLGAFGGGGMGGAELGGPGEVEEVVVEVLWAGGWCWLGRGCGCLGTRCRLRRWLGAWVAAGDGEKKGE